ncbi:hypothetical protein IFM89_005286 [Coptis chinensis]|uniref:Methyltransferase type 11 domain-containing protein n=1 Tax=Coptis chinensis TaxID=261450 RepID=A0A835IUA1_9MAGN|nr:hypothetical protein IFM89_005286 [Coptis chinensis]
MPTYINKTEVEVMATVISYVPTVFHSTAITQLTTTYSKHPHFCFFKQLKKPRVEATASSSSSSLTATTTVEVNQAVCKSFDVDWGNVTCGGEELSLIERGSRGVFVCSTTVGGGRWLGNLLCQSSLGLLSYGVPIYHTDNSGKLIGTIRKEWRGDFLHLLVCSRHRSKKRALICVRLQVLLATAELSRPPGFGDVVEEIQNSNFESSNQVNQEPANNGIEVYNAVCEGAVSHAPVPEVVRTPTLEAQDTNSGVFQDRADEKEVNTNTDILACPICYNQLIDIGDPGLTVKTIPGPSFQCNTCKKSYDSNDTYLDLTVAGGAKQYSEYIPPSTELFRTPLVSFLYERGWRQSFSIWGGFPGPDKEFKLAKDYLKPVLGGNIIDASCGSGLFTRLFSKSGLFSLVVALDFSENMLRQSYEFIKQEDGIPEENLILVRADIARLPFVSSSVDAVHAGAALHCWPSPSAAVAEISRVLRPGGVFVATTYILDGIYGTVPLLKTLRQTIGQATSSHIFLSERELEDLCEACGLVNFTCARNGPFIMLSATKPC